MYRPLAVLRVLLLVNAVGLFFYRGLNARGGPWSNTDHVTAALLVLAAIAVWTGVAVWAYSRPERRRTPLLVLDLLVLDRAGWHGAKALAVPPNVTLVPLPPYSPELNPVERVWLYLRERFLSLRVFADYRAIVDACCDAWNRLVADPGRLRSLCDQPWIRNVTS